MRFLLKLLGFGLLIWGIYVLGQNIIFTTNVSPYWWRGIAADTSILAITTGSLMLVLCPKDVKTLGWIAIVIGIVLVFFSSRAILNPTSLWQFLLSFMAITVGYRMLTTGRSPF